MTLGAFHLGGSTWGNMATKGVALYLLRESWLWAGPELLSDSDSESGSGALTGEETRRGGS